MVAKYSDMPSAAPAGGGTVVPANRADVAKERFQTPTEAAGERYELRDPFAETTYRSESFGAIAAKADQLGSLRFTAITTDGKRTPVTKTDGDWQRGPQLAALSARAIDPATDRDEPHGPSKSGRHGNDRADAGLKETDGRTLAKLEAQAERASMISKLEGALGERYIIKRAPALGPLSVGQTEYRFRGDTSRVAFTESTFRLTTDTNSPSVARSMVDVAQARNWKGIRVAGSEDFRRMVWLEASARGVKALGYEPNPADLELLRRERDARQVNQIEADINSPTPSPAEKTSGRGGGRKAVMAAIEAVLVAKHVPGAQRAAVLAAANEQMAQRARAGQSPRVKVYDKAAPVQRPVKVPALDVTQVRDRAGPSHMR